jgi:hypothetical protein
VSADGLHAEQRARVLIDAQLTAAGWHVCDLNQLDLINDPHSAVREVIMKVGSGRADYVLRASKHFIQAILDFPKIAKLALLSRASPVRFWPGAHASSSESPLVS